MRAPSSLPSLGLHLLASTATSTLQGWLPVARPGSARRDQIRVGAYQSRSARGSSWRCVERGGMDCPVPDTLDHWPGPRASSFSLWASSSPSLEPGACMRAAQATLCLPWLTSTGCTRYGGQAGAAVWALPPAPTSSPPKPTHTPTHPVFLHHHRRPSSPVSFISHLNASAASPHAKTTHAILFAALSWAKNSLGLYISKQNHHLPVLVDGHDGPQTWVYARSISSPPRTACARTSKTAAHLLPSFVQDVVGVETPNVPSPAPCSATVAAKAGRRARCSPGTPSTPTRAPIYPPINN